MYGLAICGAIDEAIHRHQRATRNTGRTSHRLSARRPDIAFEGANRNQTTTLLPECLDDWVDESNPVRVVDAFVDALDLRQLSFDRIVPEVIGRPSYHPSGPLKLYIYGYPTASSRAVVW